MCPSCSPSAAFYIKQLVTKRVPSPFVPKIEMTDEAAVLKTRKQKQKPILETSKAKNVAKNGVAVKKHIEKKPKSKWIGWVEVSSDGEQEFKQKVDAQWDVEDDIIGKRRRVSNAMIQENELSPRALRARSRPEQQVNKRARDEHEQEGEDEGKDDDEDMDAEPDISLYEEKEDTSVNTGTGSDEPDESLYEEKGDTSVDTSAESKESEESEDSLYQENPQDAPVRRRESLISISSQNSEDSEEGPVRRRARVIYTSSDDSEDSGDPMDVDQEPTSVEINSSDELSDPSSSSGDKTPSSVGQASFISEGSHEQIPSQPEATDNEDSMDLAYEDAMEYQNEEPKESHSNPPTGPEYVDDDDVDNDVQGLQASNTATPIVDNASLQNQRQVNCWGQFHESAVRSTLPRLG